MKKTVSGSRPQAELWECLADTDRRRLRRVAAVLLACEERADALLDEARNEMRIAKVSEEFAGRFATRIVVRLAISRVQQTEYSRQRVSDGDLFSAAVPLSFLPWPERVAFVLREVLAYSRRDTALLLNMTDQQIDRLVAMARLRGATRLRSGIETENMDVPVEFSQPPIPALTLLPVTRERCAEIHEFPAFRFTPEHVFRAV